MPKQVKKSLMQNNYEKSHLIIDTILSTEKNPDNIQYQIVKAFFKQYHNNNLDLAYNIANESFNHNLIAGYKYLELCELSNRKGEFYDIAIKNPLMNL